MRRFFARSHVLALLFAVSMLAACATRPPTDRGVRFDSSELSREELTRYTTVGDAVRALRSVWLQQRTPVRLSSAGSTNPVWVYRDGTRVGGPEVLRNLSTSEVAEVRYFDAVQASQRWGINHENGVIHVTSR